MTVMNEILKDNYYYKKITRNWEYDLIQTKNKSLKELLTKEVSDKINDDEVETYMLICDYKIIGFFSLKHCNYEIFPKNKCNVLRILCLYVYEQYRLKGVGTEILNDIIWSLKHNLDYEYEYIVSNSFVNSSLFFLKNGFDFYRNNKLCYNKRNIIEMYKKLV